MSAVSPPAAARTCAASAPFARSASRGAKSLDLNASQIARSMRFSSTRFCSAACASGSTAAGRAAPAPAPSPAPGAASGASAKRADLRDDDDAFFSADRGGGPRGVSGASGASDSPSSNVARGRGAGSALTRFAGGSSLVRSTTSRGARASSALRSPVTTTSSSSSRSAGSRGGGSSARGAASARGRFSRLRRYDGDARFGMRVDAGRARRRELPVHGREPRSEPRLRARKRLDVAFRDFDAAWRDGPWRFGVARRPMETCVAFFAVRQPEGRGAHVIPRCRDVTRRPRKRRGDGPRLFCVGKRRQVR